MTVQMIPTFIPMVPTLTTSECVYKMSQGWESILHELPSPSIGFYNADGNSISSLSLPSYQLSLSLSPTELHATSHQPQTSSLSPSELHATPRLLQTSSLSPAELHATPHQPHTSSLSPAELLATPNQSHTWSSSILQSIHNSVQQNNGTPTQIMHFCP